MQVQPSVEKELLRIANVEIVIVLFICILTHYHNPSMVAGIALGDVYVRIGLGTTQRDENKRMIGDNSILGRDRYLTA